MDVQIPLQGTRDQRLTVSGKTTSEMAAHTLIRSFLDKIIVCSRLSRTLSRARHVPFFGEHC
jgi:hypothetical protein